MTTYRVIDRTAEFGNRSAEYTTLAMAHAAFMQLVAQKKECCIRSWPMFEMIEEYKPAADVYSIYTYELEAGRYFTFGEFASYDDALSAGLLLLPHGRWLVAQD